MSTEMTKQTRDIKLVTFEIRNLFRQAQEMALYYAVEIGRKLVEAKELLPHGAWGAWLKTEVEFSQSTANNFMRLFEEYAEKQIGIFGAEINSQTLGNLSYTKALKLLTLPADEREDFVEAHDVDNMSTRDLDALIKERDEAREKAQKADDAAMRLLQQAKEADERVHELEAELEELRSRPIDVAVQEPDPSAVDAAAAAKIKAEKEKLKAAHEKAVKKKEDELAKRIAEAEKMKAEAETASAMLQGKLDHAAREKEILQKERDDLQKKLATSDEVTAQFKVLAKEVQGILNTMCDLMLKAPPEKAEAMKKLLLNLSDTLKSKAAQP